MDGNIINYLQGIAPALPPEIISRETYSKIMDMAAGFKRIAASEYIMETHLHAEAAEVDFSLRVLAQEKAALISCLNSQDFMLLSGDETWGKITGFIKSWPPGCSDIWLEMDYGEYDRQIPRPCFFFNAGALKNNIGIDYDLLYNSLSHLLDLGKLAAIWPNLTPVIQKLPQEAGLFQIGVMLARNNDRVRVFTAELTRQQVSAYLAAINWEGSYEELEQLFKLVHPFSDGQYIVDFDVTKQGISEKIGINFGLAKKQDLPAYLDVLWEHGLCTWSKKQGVLSWSGSRGCYLGPDYGFSALIKNISHFKMSIIPQAGLTAKAYLRIAGIYLKELFKTAAIANNSC